MTVTNDFVWYSNDLRRQLSSPTSPWAIPHAHDDFNISRDNAQCIWRRKWQSKYRLLNYSRQTHLLYYIIRGASPAAATQLVISSITAQHERVRQALAEQRERCAHVAIKYCVKDLPDSKERTRAISELWLKTKDWDTAKGVEDAWDLYYVIKEDLRELEGELRMLGISGCGSRRATEVWDDDEGEEGQEGPQF